MSEYSPVTPAIVDELRTIVGTRGVAVYSEKLHATAAMR